MLVLTTKVNEVNFGGGIYNEGKITMFEQADFRYNGGAVSWWRHKIPFHDMVSNMQVTLSSELCGLSATSKFPRYILSPDSLY